MEGLSSKPDNKTVQQLVFIINKSKTMFSYKKTPETKNTTFTEKISDTVFLNYHNN
jgi:hypothetical protein